MNIFSNLIQQHDELALLVNCEQNLFRDQRFFFVRPISYIIALTTCNSVSPFDLKFI